jgi:hypothetical protein
MAFKAVAEQTDGDFSFMKRTLPPSGRRPPAHRHTNCSVAFFIFEGTVTVELEGRPWPGKRRVGSMANRDLGSTAKDLPGLVGTMSLSTASSLSRRASAGGYPLRADP